MSSFEHDITRRSFIHSWGATGVLSIFSLSPAQGANQPSTPQKHQYKKQNRDQIADIVDGKLQGAIDHFHEYLERYPTDLESLYGLALAHTQAGNFEEALDYLQQAVDHGMPFERFVAGPRRLFEPLTETPAFQQRADYYTGQLIHGPLLGTVTDSSARFWVRTRDPVSVQVYVRRPGDQQIRSSNIVDTSPAADYTAIVTVDGIDSSEHRGS